MSMNLHLKSKRNPDKQFEKLWQTPTFPFYTVYKSLIKEDMVNGNCVDRVLRDMYWQWCWQQTHNGAPMNIIKNHLNEMEEFIKDCGGIDECDLYFM